MKNKFEEYYRQMEKNARKILQNANCSLSGNGIILS
jgi:hypothetical protein